MRSYYYKLAWRNLWRNQRRTMITMSSMAFALVFSIVMSSMTLGLNDRFISQNIEAYTGYLQIQTEDYVEESSLDHSLAYSKSLLDSLKQIPNVKTVVPHTQSFVLASNGTHTKGALVSAVDQYAEKGMADPTHFLAHYYLSTKVLAHYNRDFPQDKVGQKRLLENEHTYFINRISLKIQLEIEGEALDSLCTWSHFPAESFLPSSRGVLVSSQLAQYLQVAPGDSLILLGQGYHGVSAADFVPVRGIVKMASPELDNKLIYMTQSYAETFWNMPGRAGFISINLEHNRKMLSTQKAIEEILPPNLRVRNWEEIAPQLKNQIDDADVERLLYIFILYLILFFGILGTMQMMVSERRPEFNVLIALGMKRTDLVLVFSFEMIILAFASIIVGSILSLFYFWIMQPIPLVMTGNIARTMQQMGYSPMFYIAGLGPYCLNQIYTVLIMFVVALIFPVRYIWRWNLLKEKS